MYLFGNRFDKLDAMKLIPPHEVSRPSQYTRTSRIVGIMRIAPKAGQITRLISGRGFGTLEIIMGDADALESDPAQVPS